MGQTFKSIVERENSGNFQKGRNKSQRDGIKNKRSRETKVEVVYITTRNCRENTDTGREVIIKTRVLSNHPEMKEMKLQAIEIH